MGFRRMPRVIAASTVLAGAAVVFFGGAYARTDLGNPDDTEADSAPQVSLEPADGASERPRDVIHGVVRTSNGDAAVGIAVDLVPLFTNEGAETRSSETDDAGAFVFTGIDVTPGTPYVVDAHFDDTTFPSEVLRFGRDFDDPVRLVVAQTTRSSRSLRVDVESIAIVGDQTGMQAVHSITVRNRGQRAFTGGLELPLLPGANAIQPGPALDRRHLELEHGTIVSTAPVLPGRRDYTYTYVASMPRDGVRFRHRATYPTVRFDLLLGGELAMRPHRLFKELSSVRLQDRTYARHESHDVEPTASYTLHIVAKQPSQMFRNAGLVVAGVVAAVVIAFPLVRRRRNRPVHAPDHDAVATQ